MLREVTATRYIEPLTTGGSVPGVVEADDLGMYVVYFPDPLIQAVAGCARMAGPGRPEVRRPPRTPPATAEEQRCGQGSATTCAA
ncbi:hypothetical protein GCM10010365_62550 [Streptomyces poonensis]|uniref:Uncharacterized protein n=1 Tax=Streptomyces poonensis TaxID=68255 RepID=A0A918UU52_9ACTN|nr:hypothetical protein GCM10010365_62550 [Streptomyces poonensis]GLJ93197.1 hypothetical protein GCM10017589_58090 [Streptomyces poonensis]